MRRCSASVCLRSLQAKILALFIHDFKKSRSLPSAFAALQQHSPAVTSPSQQRVCCLACTAPSTEETKSRTQTPSTHPNPKNIGLYDQAPRAVAVGQEARQPRGRGRGTVPRT